MHKTPFKYEAPDKRLRLPILKVELCLSRGDRKCGVKPRQVVTLQGTHLLYIAQPAPPSLPPTQEVTAVYSFPWTRKGKSTCETHLPPSKPFKLVYSSKKHLTRLKPKIQTNTSIVPYTVLYKILDKVV